MKRSEIAFGLLRIPNDVGMVLLGFYLGYKLRLALGSELETLPTPQENVRTTLIFASLLVLVFALFGLYRFKNNRNLFNELKEVAIHAMVWVLVIMAYFFVIRELFYSRLALGFSVCFSILLILLGRYLIKSFKRLFLHFGIGKQNILLIGENKISRALASSLKKDPHYHVHGPILSSENLINTVRKHGIDEIIQTSQKLNEMQNHHILEFCQEHHLEYRFVPDILEIERSNIEIEAIAGYPLIHLKASALDGWGKVYKRVFDLFFSSLGLLLLSPLFLLIAVGIKLDSRGPILFSKLDDGQPAVRIGQHGKAFRFYKFRTMQDKTHNQRYSELASRNIRKGPLVKIKDDPRITFFGRFLRRWDLDELPQLWNVFTGKMSLVGPRAHLPEEVEKYEKHHKFLLTLKPGITGISQVSGRSDLDFEDEAQLDTTYIKHWSPITDLKILFKTAKVVLQGHAAE